MQPNEFSRPYSPEDIIDANLREIAERAGAVWEQDMAHLGELAEEIARGAIPDADFIQTLTEHKPRSHFQTADPRNTFAAARMRLLDTTRQVFVCKELNRILDADTALIPELFFEDAEPITEEARGRIAYQHSSYADDAFLCFSKLLPTPRASYAHSFGAVCEDVYNGLCEYGILPLESSSEGQLTGFSRLIDKFDLKIAATCDISATDGIRYTKFALLCRSLNPMQEQQAEKKCFFEFSNPLNTEPSASSILSAAALCGLTLHRLDCRAGDEESEPERAVHYVFQTEAETLPPFLLYLAMSAPSYRPTGIYIHLNEKDKEHG